LILLLSQIFHLCHSFSIQPHRPTKGSSSSSYNKKNTLLKYRQDDARTTTTTEELRRDIALIATHPEQKIQISADSVIGGSINVTKIEFLDHDDNKRNGKRVEPAEESEDSGDGDDNADGTAGSSANHPTPLATIRSMWRRRNARTAEEGIRREKAVQLSNILAKANDIEAAPSRRYGARTIMGLIHALAEEVDDLNVEVDARRDTPLWGKQIDAIRIKFSRLGFKPLRMGGLDQAFHEYKTKFPDTEQGAFHMDKQLYDLSSADEAFDRIDVDNSGALDRDEIAEALATAARSSDETEHRKLREGLKGLADELVALYDFNGDGVVDRYEYRTMVEDMAALQENQESERQEEEDRLRSESAKSEGGWMETIKGFVLGLLFRKRNDVLPETVNGDVNATTNSQSSDSAITTRGDDLTSAAPNLGDDNKEAQDHRGGLVFDGMQPTGVIRRISTVTDEQINSLMSKDLGSITISDLKIDLRRLLFGAIPFVKHIVPGGPLVLEPFTVTITASFNSQDIKNSFLLDAGLRRLVAQAIRRRVRSLRDMLDGAVFYGRSWKMSSKSAPIVDVIAIEDVQFDTLGRLILTGRVRVQTTPDQPVVENAFKLRARLGTNASGRRIRLVEPELALVLECPTLWESVYVDVRDRQAVASTLLT
jgi:Ca2+-binding EF-hand superfamily protein